MADSKLWSLLEEGFVAGIRPLEKLPEPHRDDYWNIQELYDAAVAACFPKGDLGWWTFLDELEFLGYQEMMTLQLPRIFGEAYIAWTMSTDLDLSETNAP
jgi:hypothetical protein